MKAKRKSKLSDDPIIAIAQSLYRMAKLENGSGRDAWALARRLCCFLNDSRVRLREELAFSSLTIDRIGVAWFRCDERGKLDNYIMNSLPKYGLPVAIRRELLRRSAAEIVETGGKYGKPIPKSNGR